MNLKERLLQLVEKEGLNPNQFYVKTGLANGFLNTIGSNLRKPSIAKIEKAFPHWNIEYLLTGKGNDMVSVVNTSGAVNTGTVGGHNVSVQGGDYEKIIDKDKIELIGGNASKIYLQEIASLKAEIIRLEAIIKSKDETIAAKDETIEILRKK